MREWEPEGPKRPRQDDRIDWLVHAVHHLADLGNTVVDAGPQLSGLAEKVQTLQPRVGPGGLQKSPGLPGWDPRSTGGARGRVPPLGSRRVL